MIKIKNTAVFLMMKSELPGDRALIISDVRIYKDRNFFGQETGHLLICLDNGG